jgi:hypothetical protein
MSTELKNSTTEELRLRNSLAQMQQRYDFEVRDKERTHADDVQRLVDNETKQLDDLRKDYEVKISQEAESLEQKLHEIRLNHDEQIATEQRAGEKELEKVKLSNQKKIEEYKKNGDAQIEALRKQLQASAETLHAQAKKREMHRESEERKTVT